MVLKQLTASVKPHKRIITFVISYLCEDFALIVLKTHLNSCSEERYSTLLGSDRDRDKRGYHSDFSYFPPYPYLPHSSEIYCCSSFVSPQFAYQIFKVTNKDGTRKTSKKSEQGTRHKIMSTAEGTRQTVIFSRG